MWLLLQMPIEVTEWSERKRFYFAIPKCILTHMHIAHNAKSDHQFNVKLPLIFYLKNWEEEKRKEIFPWNSTDFRNFFLGFSVISSVYRNWKLGDGNSREFAFAWISLREKKTKWIPRIYHTPFHHFQRIINPIQIFILQFVSHRPIDTLNTNCLHINISHLHNENHIFPDWIQFNKWKEDQINVHCHFCW